MIRRILNLIVALSTIAVSATAQTLSVSSIETELGAQTEIVVNVEGASEMTALQFTLNLPDGVSLSYLKGNCGMYLGDATDEHVMSVSPLSDGGRFIMIYSTDLNTFSDGVLLRIPVKMPAEVCSENGSFSDICFSTVNADSRECSDVAFTATSKLPEVRTEFEVNGIHYVFLENYYGEEGLSVWVTSTGGNVLSGDEENTYSGDITIPGVVTYGNVQYPVVGIRSEAFAKCTINSLTLAEGVKYLVPYNYGTCFGYDNTTKIKEVYLPSTFTISRKDAYLDEANGYRFFPGDMGLEKIVIADGNPEFDSRDNCNAIIETATNTLWDGCKGTVIPSSVETIGAMAFFGSDIEECIIPEGVKKIQGNAFAQCANLQKVIIPTSVDEVVGTLLFQGCTNLKTVEIPQTTLIRSAIGFEGDGEASGAKAIPASMFSGCSSLQEFVIPNDVVYIGTGAFRNCQSLSSITIPSGVTTIGGLAFRSCEGLRSVTLLSQVPPTVKESSFMNLYEQIRLNVPEGAEEAYKQHEVWGKFFKEEEPVDPEPTIASGAYYLYHAESKRFLSRGEHWGTCATVDRYGIPFVWTAEEYSLKFLDSNVHLFETDDSNIYTDNASTGFAFEEVEGGYLLKSQKSSRYLTIVDAAFTHDIVNVTNDASAAVVWQLKSKAEHDAIVAGYVEENYMNVIKAAGLTATAGDFVSYLATLNAEDKTSAIGTACFAGSVGEWKFTELRHQDRQPAYGTDFCELWQATGYYTQTITGLAEGIYKVTMQGYERTGGWAECNTLGEKGYEITTATLSANGEEVNLKSWYSGKSGEDDPDNTNQAVAKFGEGTPMNEIYTYVGEAGTLDLMVNIPSHVGGNWVLFNNFTLTQYSVDVTDIESSVLEAQGSQLIYDLMGRRVTHPTKGIYIVNGKKVVLK